MIRKDFTICEGVEWIDITDPTAEIMAQLSEQYRLNSYIVKDCMEPDHLPKYDLAGDIHFVILRYFTFKSQKGSSSIQELTNKIAIFYTSSFLITIHLEEIAFIELINRKFLEENKCSSSAEVLMRIVWHSLATFDDPVQRLSEQVDFHENNILVRKTIDDQMTQLYFLKREAALLHKVIVLMVEPINHLPGEEAHAVALQDVKDEHLKMLTLYGQVLDEVTNLMSLYMSFTSQRNNEVMKVLTIFSVFFLPITFLSSLYGMNFVHMPEIDKKYAYPIVLGVMVLITIGIFLWFKKKGWLK